jgi:hypothetical protein
MGLFHGFRHDSRKRLSEPFNESSTCVSIPHDENRFAPGEGHVARAALRQYPDRERHVGVARGLAIKERPFAAWDVKGGVRGRLLLLLNCRDCERQMTVFGILLSADVNFDVRWHLRFVPVGNLGSRLRPAAGHRQDDQENNQSPVHGPISGENG